MINIMRTVNRSGVTVLLIEHSMNVVMEVSQWIHVMNFGELIAEGPPEEVRENPEVREAYLVGVGRE